MERDRSSKVIAIVALVVAVLGVSLGFASYSEYLNISSEALVTPDATKFNVKFSTVSDTITPGNVTPTGSGDAATLSGTTISGLKANFTEPGESTTYKFFVRNSGEYDAYLTAVTFGKITYTEEVDGETVTKEVDKRCLAVSGENQADNALVQAACNDINVFVTVGADSNTMDLDSSLAPISEHMLGKNSFEEVTVKVVYDDNENRADGDFTVEFGDITLTYSSVDSATGA